MDFVWALVAMPVLALLFTAFVAAREKPADLPDSVVSFSKHSCHARKTAETFRRGRREIRWLSVKELDHIVFTPDEVIFIDLRCPSEAGDFPHAAKHVLFIAPNRLIDVLKRLPPETSAVLYGASGLSKSMIWAISTLSGMASIYVLTGVPMYSEVT